MSENNWYEKHSKPGRECGGNGQIEGAEGEPEAWRPDAETAPGSLGQKRTMERSYDAGGWKQICHVKAGGA